MHVIVSFFVGALFAVGLGISGMTQPEKVIGFLDFFGSWDGTLLFVMGGATTMYFVAFRVVRGHAPVLTANWNLPTRTQIDARLIIGSAMFGIGWGLAGFCPGPALTSVGTGMSDVLVFVGSMVAGMYVFAGLDKLLARATTAPAPN